MAIFTYTTSADFDSFDVFLGTSIQAGRSSTGFSYLSQLSGALITVTGTGFTYDDAGKPLTGTVNKMLASDADWGGTVSITGLSLQVTDLVSKLLGFFGGTASTAADAEAFQIAIRNGGDVIHHEVDFGRSISGYNGFDKIYDGAGDSGLFGGAGQDTLYGGAGNDSLDGGAAIDVLYGGGGNDTLDGGAGSDLIYGGGDDDLATWAKLTQGVKVTDDSFQGTVTVYVTAGSDTDQVRGAAMMELTDFADTVVVTKALRQAITFFARDGDDSYQVFYSDDTVYGGAGNDTIRGAAVADGGTGVDSISGHILAFWSADDGGHGAKVDFSLAKNRVQDDGFGNVEDSFGLGAYGTKWGDRLLGGSFAETLAGNDGNDTLNGRLGDDTVYGGAGNDLVQGDVGNDLVAGGAGSDTVNGGAGTDELTLWDDTVLHGAKVDLGLTLAQDDGFGTQDTLIGIENVTGTRFGDTLLGNYLGNLIWGVTGNDLVDGRGGNDEIYGGDGNDTLRGYVGDDTLMGGAGVDRQEGGDGIDLLGFWNEDDGSAHAVWVNLAAAKQVLNDGYGNTEVAIGFEQVAGSDWGDTISGGAGNDTIWGNAGNDTLRGYIGNDVLYGGEGNDFVSGGAGNDELWGFAGNDTLEGLDGADMFYFNDDGSVDTVKDFAHGIDWLMLWQFAPDLVLNAALADAQFASGAGLRAATTATQRVVYDTTTGDVLLDADGLGGNGAQVIARLANHAALSASDIWIS